MAGVEIKKDKSGKKAELLALRNGIHTMHLSSHFGGHR
jgi:hypothetical protein